MTGCPPTSLSLNKRVAVHLPERSRVGLLTPDDVDVRTTVHEYGGGDFVVFDGTIVYSRFEDQRLYRMAVDGDNSEPITPEPPEPQATRYADATVTPDREHIYCVRERHHGEDVGDQPVNELVSLPVSGATEPTIVASGHDFYSFPRVSPDGTRLAWTTWDHPQMPWDGTELHVAAIERDGTLTDERTVMGGPEESVFQPEWGPDGRLYTISDRTGWWNLYRLDPDTDQEPTVVLDDDAEFGTPQWVFGSGTYQLLDDGLVVAMRDAAGSHEMIVLDPDSGSYRSAGLPYDVFPHPRVATDGETVLTVGAGPATPPSIVRWTPDGKSEPTDSADPETDVLRRSFTLDVAPDAISRPTHVTYPTRSPDHEHDRTQTDSPEQDRTQTDSPEHEGTQTDSPEHEGTQTDSPEHEGTQTDSPEHEGTQTDSPEHDGTQTDSPEQDRSESAHAFYYPPTHPDVEAPEDELPPLVVNVHGGPTSMTRPIVDPEIQYFTSRGFAVADVNYRGSTGYGRSYRDRLKGNWGVLDTIDCVEAARYLGREGKVDTDRQAIRGGSAGGYATLCALAFHDTFDAGVSYYGVADLRQLAEQTHKFESRYLDGLVGPLPDAAETYEDRSPASHADQIDAPLLVLQDSEDRVVPSEQADDMVAALVDNETRYAYFEYLEERHGFRRAPSRRHALTAECAFFASVFDFEPADSLEPLELDQGSFRKRTIDPTE